MFPERKSFRSSGQDREEGAHISMGQFIAQGCLTHRPPHPTQVSQESDSLARTETAPGLQVKPGSMGKWVRKQRLQDASACFPSWQNQSSGTLRMETRPPGHTVCWPWV